jgi:hypothetical protein
MSASKRKGTAFETLVVDWLRDHGHRWVERRALTGNKDKGDVVLECKNERSFDLGTWVAEAQAEAANAGVHIWAVVAKRRMKGDAGEQYVITTLDVFNRLLIDNAEELAS